LALVPYQVFTSYYVAKGGRLDYYEKVALLLVLICHILLHNMIVTQFIKLLQSEEWENEMG